MWPARREMNRDECRKYLRYLELDAYGSMVSVLRAQGPFTSEKQKLLQELARVLHISSERHRAEVRRAVNDEKLTQIAEQLGGPNTGTDWMIEGRRVIPLLPRLKARSAFTTLANSLSLATAAANDRKPLVLDKIEQSKDIYESQVKVKVEESSSDTDEIVPGDDESSNERLSLEEVSTLELESERQGSNHEVVQLSIANRKRKSPSPLPTAPPHKVLVLSSSSLGNSNHCTDNPARHIQIPNSSLDSVAAKNHTTDTNQSLASKSKPKPVLQNKLNTKLCHKVTGNSHSISASNPKSSIQSVQTSEGKPEPKLTASNNSERAAAICPGTAVSSGPGPPQTKKATLNFQTTAKTGANSKPVNIPQHPTKLGSKPNVIVIQKGHTKGVTLSHAGKEVLGKVVIGGKNLSVAPQKMNNGDQTANVVSSRHSNAGSTIVFNLQEASEKKKVPQLLDSSSVLASSPKTVIHNTNARSLKEETNTDLCTIDEVLDDEETLTGSSSEENERNDECENANSLDSIDSLGNAEIVIDTSQLTEDVSELELKQIVCSSEMEMKELSGSEISLDNVQYLVEGSENYILEETRSPILISQNVIDNT